MNSTKDKLLIIVGPTASGKTGLSVRLAQKFGGEIISADSRQVYRRLDVGTAKVTKEEMGGIEHHLIDVCDIENVYTAMDFRREAETAILACQNRGHLPIIVGGTFFYIDVLLGRINPASVLPKPELRAELEKKSLTELQQQLQIKDPHRYQSIDIYNKRRLIRALEIISELDYVPIPSPTSPSLITGLNQVLFLGLKSDKDTLRENYKNRAESWLNQGFKKEVLDLLKDGVTRDRLQEIGFEYTLMLSLIDGEISESEFVQKFIEKNWQYAKRQMTWLKKNSDIKWFALEDQEIFEEVDKFLKQK